MIEDEKACEVEKAHGKEDVSGDGNDDRVREDSRRVGRLENRGQKRGGEKGDGESGQKGFRQGSIKAVASGAGSPVRWAVAFLKEDDSPQRQDGQGEGGITAGLFPGTGWVRRKANRKAFRGPSIPPEQADRKRRNPQSG